MRVTDGDRLLVPLYHGSSCIFLGSIREIGLGAKDPNVELRSHELLTELAQMEGWNWSADPELALMELSIRSAIDQRVSGGGFNFRHGSTYLTPSQLTAVRYALLNQHGSELLSMTMSLFEKLKIHDERRAHELASRFPVISELLSLEHQPLLVEARNVAIRSLRSENGDDPELVLDQIKSLMDGENPELFHLMCQQSNFELIKPISVENLNFHQILRSKGDEGLPQYALRTI